ncbi:farnesyl-pyrophosphate synthetase [Anaeramoeba flamelloides]|uniref:Farnesyl-pyrophosphate synthetase n=1 Tax=Anaeramoeba flamelloides TaxID=1746091 RepID=A0AAV7YQ83_9EUKA|nr:farnesyl-pyrophosphate synthetase [Anaeramoeba flamelloides]
MIKQNVPDGKHIRGMTVVNTYVALSGKRDKKSIKDALLLGWCLEFYHSFMSLVEDIVDDSKLRRGRSCWHQLVGMRGVNDSFTLEGFVYQLLKKYFGKHLHYLEIVELFISAGLCSELGKTLEMSTVDYKTKKPIISKYTFDHFQKIVHLKKGIVSYYLPVALGIVLATRKKVSVQSVEHQKKLKEAKKIAFQIAILNHIKNDYLDNLGSEIRTKNYTEIKMGKCSWPIVTALSQANEDEAKTLKKHYGSDQNKSIQLVQEIYNQLNLEKSYKDFETNINKSLEYSLNNLKHNPKEIFFFLIDQSKK